MGQVMRAAVAAFAALVWSAVPAAAQDRKGSYEPQVGQSGKDVIWVPTPDEVVAKMLDMAQVAPGDVVVDLGSGDGKIAIAAARRGAIAKGVEYNPDMVELSKRRAKEAGVKVEFVQGDIFQTDFTKADVITLYLLPHLNEKLKPTILKMKPGTRVTSHSFRMGDWEPDKTATADGRDAHFWVVPANVGGEWKIEVGPHAGPTMKIKQTYQKLEGQAQWGNRAGPLRDPVVKGPYVSFLIADERGTLHKFEGVTDHDGPMLGVVTPEKGGAPRLFRATRR